jgi:hypothetical protein
MFKGPAALTGASTVSTSGAITTSGNISTTGTGTITSAGNATVGGTLGVTGVLTTTAGLTVGNALTVTAGGVTVTGAGITVGGNIVMAGSKLTGLGSPAQNDEAVTKGYADTNYAAAGSAGDTVLANVTSMSSAGVYASVDINSNNVINFANTVDTTIGQITATLGVGTASNGKKLFVSWAAKNNAHTSLKVDFGNNKIYDAEGTEARYLTFANVGASILMFYSVVAGTGHWIISGSGATPSTS